MLLVDPADVTVEITDLVTEHNDVVIICHSTGGNPDYVQTYQWEFTSKYAEQGLQPDFDCEERQCTIKDISLEYAGEYKCTATGVGTTMVMLLGSQLLNVSDIITHTDT